MKGQLESADDAVASAMGAARGIQSVQGASSLIKLRGPAAQILNLSSAAAGTMPQLIEQAWEPVDKIACDLELRARVISVTPTPGGTYTGLIPVVRYELLVSQGEQVWEEPWPQLPVAAGNPFQFPMVPARGMSLRLSGREVRARFYYQGQLSGVQQIAAVQLAVSYEPVLGSQCGCAYPHESLAQNIAPPVGPGGALQVQQFPITAREWRLRQTGANSGKIWGAGALAIDLFALTGGLPFAVVDANAIGLQDWQPIPTLAAFWLPAHPTEVEYR